MCSLKNLFAAIGLLFICASGFSQVLFTYGNHKVTKDEFLKAYNKNNLEEQPTDKSYREYLDLYIKFKIKVQAALDNKMDTLPNQIAELRAFRNQVVESYMKDEASLNALVDEAMERAQKDIHLAHVFIALDEKANADAEKTARDKIYAAYEQLKKGVDFGTVAAQYSEDPNAPVNKGDLGYITVMVLPYELENMAYTTPKGKYTIPFRSKKGYHIFKNLGERPAAGKMKAAQILLSFPPDPSDADMAKVKEQADSLYNALKKGADFGDLARQFSDDNITYTTGGVMMLFGVGRYDPDFTDAAFAIAGDSMVGKPVKTAFGYHIIKRLQRVPVPKDKTDKEWFDELKQQVMISDRMDVSRKVLVKKILEETGFKKSKYDEAELWRMTDSTLQQKSLPPMKGLTPGAALFSLGDEVIVLQDWQQYLEKIRNFPHLHSGKTNQQIMDQFVEEKALEYYRSHLETYNKDFAYQLNEFREGNLLFEIMQQKIWDAASADSAGLQQYYAQHKTKYWWEPSADAIILTANTKEAAEAMQKKLRIDFHQWRQYIDESDGLVMGDSGRFELGQIPVLERTNFQEGLITAPVKSDMDNSYTFAYIVKIYRERAPRSFDDARGFVINDYQSYLEEQWINELKKKYPVKVNEKVVQGLSK